MAKYHFGREHGKGLYLDQNYGCLGRALGRVVSLLVEQKLRGCEFSLGQRAH